METSLSGDSPRQNSKFQNFKLKTWTETGGLFLLLVISRLIPHPPNATAVNAVAWGIKEKFRGSGAVVVIAGLIVSDIFIGFYDWRLLISVYGSFVLIALFGQCISDNITYTRKTLLSVFAAIFFFLVTNGAVWVLSSWYPHTFAGLLACYVAGFPFLRNMIIGDIAYFSVIHVVKKFRVYDSSLAIRTVAIKSTVRPI